MIRTKIYTSDAVGTPAFLAVEAAVYGNFGVSENIRTPLPFTTHVLITEKNKRPVARLVIFDNPQVCPDGKKTLLFGQYECIDDPSVANDLLYTALKLAFESGAEQIIGPMNGSTWEDYRFSKKNNEPNFLLEPCHPVYYNDQWISAGFQPLREYTSGIDRELPWDQSEILRREEELLAGGCTIRSIDTERFREELKWLYPLVTKAFSSNYLYSVCSEKEFVEKYLRAMPLVQPGFVLAAADEKGEPAGFVFCYHNSLNKKEKQLVVKTIARSPEKRFSGLGHVLGNRIVREARRQKYVALIHAFMIREGTSTGISGTYSGETYKEYTLYCRYK